MYGTFYNGISIIFSKIRHIPLRIPNVLFTAILVFYWIKFQWVFLLGKLSFSPLKGEQNQGRIVQAAFPINLNGKNEPLIVFSQFQNSETMPNYVSSRPIQNQNPTIYNPHLQLLEANMNRIILYCNMLLDHGRVLEWVYGCHLLPLI